MLADMRIRIGETRQPGQRIERHYDAPVAHPRGIVSDAPPAGSFRHSRRVPPAELAPWVEHVWSVSWDLGSARSHEAVILPHPNVHLVFEDGVATVLGVHTGRFTRHMQGRGDVLGVKFRAGCFYPFLGRSVSSIRGRTLPAEDVFGEAITAVAERVARTAALDDASRAAVLADAFRDRFPRPGAPAERARDCVDLIQRNRTIKSLDMLVWETGMPKRSLQRLFEVHVGVPAKWVIRLFRLHDVVDAIRTGAAPVWAALAAELGYFDQAHMINDFRAVVGYSPEKAVQLHGGTAASDDASPPHSGPRQGGG
jgi:AraC-like DNA-binding protein